MREAFDHRVGVCLSHPALGHGTGETAPHMLQPYRLHRVIAISERRPGPLLVDEWPHRSTGLLRHTGRATMRLRCALAPGHATHCSETCCPDQVILSRIWMQRVILNGAEAADHTSEGHASLELISLSVVGTGRAEVCQSSGFHR